MTDRESNRLDQSSKSLLKLKNELNLKDAWRYCNRDKTEYTYIDPSGRNRNSRIDAILLSPFLTNSLTTSCIVQAPSPDHKAVVITLKCNENKRGKGFWKLNNSIIDNKDYEEGVRALVNDINLEYGNINNANILWEYIKIRIKLFSIAYSVNLAKSKRTKINILEEKLNEFDNKNVVDNIRDTSLDRSQMKKELDHQYLQRAKGYQVRSRAKWVQEGEKSSAYFLNLEKIRQTNNRIEELKDDSGVTHRSDREILKVIDTYYSNLYSSKHTPESEIEEYFNSIHPDAHVKLSNENMTQCEGPISIEECKAVLTTMKGNKSPGLDGLSVEFYKKFWDILGTIIVASFNESYEHGSLSDSQRKSVITLIFKTGNIENIKNYRPISITNIDYKILAMTLAKRLQRVIGSIVSTDQSAYIKGRYIGTNIKLVCDIIEYFDKIEQNGLLLSLDFRKAFDTIEHNFLFKALQWFGFGHSFLKWVKTLYSNSVACVKNNGYLSPGFSLSCGIRQGCPVSALLFNICVEIMGIKIRSDGFLKGFNFGNNNKNVKISQYADDTVVCINDDSEVLHLFSLVNAFGKVSGLQLNTDKCEGYWLGNMKGQQFNCTKYGIKWPDSMKYLGIHVGYDKQSNLVNNWLKKIDKIETILGKWTKRDLSLIGRVQIIKSMALSQITLAASTLPIPDNIIKKLNTIFFKFLWQSTDKVKRVKVIMSMEHGGLNMVDVQSYFEAIKANWINRLKNANPDNDCWAQIPYRIFNCIGLDINHINYNFDSSVEFEALNDLPLFYKEVVQFYNKIYVTNKDHFLQNILTQPIWGNKHVTKKVGRKKKVLFLRDWMWGATYFRSSVREWPPRRKFYFPKNY